MRIDPKILSALEHLLKYGVQIRIMQVADAVWYTLHVLQTDPDYQILVIQYDETMDIDFCVVCKKRNMVHVAIEVARILDCVLYDHNDMVVQYTKEKP